MAMPYTPISGNLPWPTSQAPFPTTLAGIGPYAQSQYANSMGMNQADYSNIIGGYGQVGAQQQAAFQGIQKGWGNLYGNVTKGIQGTQAANLQQIQDQYAQMGGQATQGLTNAGLGNTTVTSSVNRGLGLDQAKATTNAQDQFAQLMAGYQSQIGQQALGSRQNMAISNSQLGQNQLQFMNSVSMGYPNPALYAQLAQQYGMFNQANQDRARLGGMGGGGGGSQGLGYTPAPAPSNYAAGGNMNGMPSSGQSLPQFFNPYSGSASAGNIFGSGINGQGFGGGMNYGGSQGMDYGPTSGQPGYGPQPDMSQMYSQYAGGGDF